MKSILHTTKQTSVVLCIDVEPDVREVGLDNSEASNWTGFEKTFELLSQLRPLLEDATGKRVKFSWLLRMDPQIERAFGTATFVTTRYRSCIDTLLMAGDEVGLHIHGWRWIENPQGWVADMADQRWVEHCVRSSFEAFERGMGQTCTSVRFGDRWLDHETVTLLRRLGARFELTLEPGMEGGIGDTPDGRFTGTLPDLRHAPRRPYRPSEDDFRTEALSGPDDFFILPLSTVKRGWPAKPNPLLSSSTSVFTKSGSNLEGCHDTTNCEVISGWAWDNSRPDDPINVDIYDGDDLLAIVTANMFRPDLKDAGKGNGYHAFEFPILDFLKDGVSHSLKVKIAGTDFPLNLTPREVNCAKSAEPKIEYLTLNLSFNSAQFCHSLDEVLEGGRSDYLGMIMRSDAAVTPPQSSNLALSAAYIVKHPLVSQFVFDTPADAVERLAGVRVKPCQVGLASS